MINAFGTGPRTAGAAEIRLLLRGPAGAAAELARLENLARYNAALAMASGRWQLGRPDPDRYVPGDVVALRAFAVTADLVESRRHLAVAAGAVVAEPGTAEIAGRRLAMSLVDTAALFRAVPHFVDEAAAAGLLASQPPGPDVLDELRLPHRSIAVFLGRPIELGPEHYDWPVAWDVQRNLAERPTGELTCLGQVRARGGGIDAVVLTEAPDGGLGDEVLWLVGANPDPTRPGPGRFDRQRAVVWGRLSAAGLAPVATNLAATVAWAEWQEPARRVSLPGDVGSREWRRQARRGEFRRHEPRGAAAGVRVLDLGRSLAAERASATADGRPGPVTHLRRAHWRLQPVGPGRAERKVVRVAATVVNAGRQAPGHTVYRVPKADPVPEPAEAEPVIDLRTVDLPDPPGEPARSVVPSPEPRPTQPEVSL